MAAGEVHQTQSLLEAAAGGAPAVLELLTDLVAANLHWEKPIVGAAQDLSEALVPEPARGCHPYCLLAAFNTLLYCYTQQEDVLWFAHCQPKPS